MKKLIHFTFYFFISCKIFAQADSIHGLYVNNFDTILGNCHKENRLLKFAQQNSFNYLALYDLHKLNLLDTANVGIDTSELLRNFIYKARVNFGIQFIGAVNEKFDYFKDSVIEFNSNCANDSEKFNVFNFEFEFWDFTQDTGVYCKYLYPIYQTCDTAVAFDYYINQLHLIDSIAHANNIISETYLGWFDSLQATRIVGNVDRILLHSYRTGITDLYDYTAERLSFLANACMNSTDTMVYFAPIFSAENSFLGPWLNTPHPFSSVYSHYLIDYNADTSSWKQYTTSLGHQWFAWGFLSKFSIDDPIPLITISDSMPSCVWDTVMLTSTIADHYLWSNGEIVQSIRVDTSAFYYVTTGLNNCDTSNILNVVVNQLPPKPNIFYLNDSMCSGATMTLTSDLAGGYWWSTCACDTFISITVDTGTYAVRVYSGPNCYSESDSVSIHYFPRQQPVILKEVLPPDSINQIQPNFQLTSSFASSYDWSTNETIQNIIVDSAGDYSLHVVDLNGCPDSASIRIDSCIVPVNIPSIYTSPNCILIYGDSITLSTDPADNYFWFRNGVYDNSEPSFTDSIFQPTTYILAIYNDSFCFSYSLPKTIDICVGINDNSILSPIADYTILPIFPNPAKNYFILPINSKKSSSYVFKILDSFGKEVKIKSGKLSPGENRLLVDVNDFAKGVYFINIQIENINKALKIVLR